MTVNKTESTSTTWDALPAVVTTYLTAHRTRDVATAIRAFTENAAVTDEGHTVHGRDAIAAWLGSAGTEYTFITEFTGATTTDAGHVDVLQRLEGDFPGGVADLHYRFTLDGELISRLVIEP
ncbi:nuclear transport factor 2-like protein [Mycolicibacterium mengxianglii]|uniref:nuclear transport factor 2 family protein n=1 Tax=Mycolicibacterium mengxianglii TaxID=2736649 RepID=UPI0018EEEDB2|nr:nuclear transport factor 2 family protein [Mycolicibacterium mengxianglii]